MKKTIGSKGCLTSKTVANTKGKHDTLIASKQRTVAHRCFLQCFEAVMHIWKFLELMICILHQPKSTLLEQHFTIWRRALRWRKVREPETRRRWKWLQIRTKQAQNERNSANHRNPHRKATPLHYNRVVRMSFQGVHQHRKTIRLMNGILSAGIVPLCRTKEENVYNPKGDSSWGWELRLPLHLTELHILATAI